MTERTYYEDTYCFASSARITGGRQDQIGAFWLFDKTIFHPQGGGQPSDRGSFISNNGSISINFVREVDGEIRHYGIASIRADVGTEGKQVIDSEFRLLCSKLHSAGHLIAQITQQQIPSATPLKAFHFPEGPYIEVAGVVSTDALSSLQKAIDAAVNLPTIAAMKGITRQIRLGEFLSVPCGGTHVKNTSELGRVVIRGIKKSGSNSRIKYTLRPPV